MKSCQEQATTSSSNKLIPLFVTFILLFSTTSVVARNGQTLDLKKYLPECKIRYDRINLLKHTCEEVLQYQPLCAVPLTVSYSSFPPYVFKDNNGEVIGLLPGELF